MLPRYLIHYLLANVVQCLIILLHLNVQPLVGSREHGASLNSSTPQQQPFISTGEDTFSNVGNKNHFISLFHIKSTLKNILW